MNKLILNPLRSYHPSRVHYLYNDYITMLQKENIDIISVGSCSDKCLEQLANLCDGLLLTGGKDVDPHLYHQAPNPLTKCELIDLEQLEFKLIALFSKKNKPILGICRGIQTINVAFGGTLYQDIKETKRFSNHLQTSNEGYQHLVLPIKDTKLYQYLNKPLMTNSFHHQSINKLALGFKVNAVSIDGLIEGIERGNIIGVQWHPEKNDDYGQIQIMKMFKDLLEEKNE